jgi:demethylmenaquinone methyltransferase/2-methoxy-6-polyprenyl-1,4-benzoquinol methylase
MLVSIDRVLEYYQKVLSESTAESIMTDRIKTIFAEVAPTYKRVNHALTLGLDIFWRKKAARLAARGGGRRWLDVCSGTGDMARALCRLAPSGVQVTAVDFSLPMLSRARRPGTRPGGIQPALAALPFLPFEGETFDLVTIAFATRNINTSPKSLLACFREFYRVLKPGGRFINLETSQPANPFIRTLFHLYIKTTVLTVGRTISGSRAGYTYLASTIPRFYDAPTLAVLFREAGFGTVSFQQLFFGAVAAHLAVRRRRSRY